MLKYFNPLLQMKYRKSNKRDKKNHEQLSSSAKRMDSPDYSSSAYSSDVGNSLMSDSMMRSPKSSSPHYMMWSSGAPMVQPNGLSTHAWPPPMHGGHFTDNPYLNPIVSESLHHPGESSFYDLTNSVPELKNPVFPSPEAKPKIEESSSPRLVENSQNQNKSKFQFSSSEPISPKEMWGRRYRSDSDSYIEELNKCGSPQHSPLRSFSWESPIKPDVDLQGSEGSNGLQEVPDEDERVSDRDDLCQEEKLIESLLMCDSVANEVITKCKLLDIPREDLGKALSGLGDTIVKELVRWIKHLPFESMLPLEVQTEMLTQKWYSELLLIMSMHHAWNQLQEGSGAGQSALQHRDRHMRKLHDYLNNVMHQEINFKQLFKEAGDILELLMKIIFKLSKIGASRTEFVLLKVILLFDKGEFHICLT